MTFEISQIPFNYKQTLDSMSRLEFSNDQQELSQMSVTEINNQFNLIPDDILVTNILPYLHANDLYGFCLTNTRIGKLCNDPRVWSLKLMSEYPGFYLLNIPPKQMYKFLYNARKISVIYNGDRIGYTYWNDLQIAMSKELVRSLYPTYKDYYQVDEKLNVDVIFNVDKIVVSNYPVFVMIEALTSKLGHPPIYGIQHAFKRFQIADKRGDTPKSMTCESIFDQSILLNIYNELKKWSNVSYESDNLCDSIRAQLINIGHYIRIMPKDAIFTPEGQKVGIINTYNK